jgi:hypothetical protein
MFANFYLNPFDHFIKHTLRLRYYSRYVADFVLVHRGKRYLQHYAAFSLRRKILLTAVSGWWWKYVYISGVYRKVSLRAATPVPAGI